MSIQSIFGNPPKEFTLYKDCHYMYDGVECTFIEPLEDTTTDKNEVLIRFNNATDYIPVNQFALSPIPLTVQLLDICLADTALSLGDGVKEWKFKGDIPFSIYSNGVEYFYSNPIMVYNQESPIHVSFISDMEAVHKSFLMDHNAKKVYSEIIKK